MLFTIKDDSKNEQTIKRKIDKKGENELFGGGIKFSS